MLAILVSLVGTRTLGGVVSSLRIPLVILGQVIGGGREMGGMCLRGLRGIETGKSRSFFCACLVSLGEGIVLGILNGSWGKS